MTRELRLVTEIRSHVRKVHGSLAFSSDSDLLFCTAMRDKYASLMSLKNERKITETTLQTNQEAVVVSRFMHIEE